jgi:maltose alpha-D-glucosyltransferase/alpha-amylase
MSLFVLTLDWDGLEKDKYVHTVLEDNLLMNFIEKCRWFAGKAKAKGRYTLKIKHVTRFTHEEETFFFTIFTAKYSDNSIEAYLLPLSFIEKSRENIDERGIISDANLNDTDGYLVDATYDPKFRHALFQNIVNAEQVVQQNDSVLSFAKGKALTDETLDSSYIPDIDSSNSVFIFGEHYFYKLYRKIFTETNPEVEMVEFITQHSDFSNIPRYAGSCTWKRDGEPDVTFGMMVEVIKNEKDDWSKTGDYLNDFVEAFGQGNFQIKESVFDKVTLLAKRTAEMHHALYAPRSEENFRADGFDRAYRRFIHQKVENLIEQRYELLTDNYLKLDKQAQHLAWIFMESKELIINFVDQILTKNLDSYRTRIHGDYHLRQILVTGDDLTIIDFEGEPESSIESRKIKHSPLKDVAGMVRSYHYAVSAKLFNSPETSMVDEKVLERAANRWYKLIRDTFLEEYFSYFGSPHPLYKNNNEANYLLQFHLLEKSIYELGYEINYRPTWVKIPLKGIVEVIQEIEKLRR